MIHVWKLILILAAQITIQMLVYEAKHRFFKRKNRDEGEPSVLSRADEHAHTLWQSRFQNIPLKFYGGGAHHTFEHYFTRASNVEVRTIGDVMGWLLGCEYVSDLEQFNKRDHWQHPVDFEVTRRGDCEDFALWAWRKLVVLGHEAEFMVGKWIHDGRIGTHAWVLLTYNGEKFVFESTGRAHERILRPFETTHTHYIPFAAIDNQLRKKVYNGIVHWIMKTDLVKQATKSGMTL